MYSEEEGDALTVNSWREEGGPGKEAEKCLQSRKESRGVCYRSSRKKIFEEGGNGQQS